MKKFVYSLIGFFILIIFIFLFLYNFLIRHEPDYVSMEPNIAPKMICFFLPNPYENIKDIKRGDIVLIPFCNNGSAHLNAKRVIGLPGDKIIITDSTVSVNDQILSKKLYSANGDYRYYTEKNGEVEYNVAYDIHSMKRNPFPPDTIYILNYHVFVLNDSRKRIWNRIEESHLFSYTIVGKLIFTY